MAIILDYASLKTAIADTLARSDLTAFVPNFIQNGEARIYRELRVRQMIASADWSLLVADGGAFVSIAANYLELYTATLDTTPRMKLNRVSIEVAQMEFPRNGSTGRPRYIVSSGATLAVFPAPDAAYTVKAQYYARTASMSADADAPWLIADAHDLIFFASLVAAEPFIKNDARLPLWEQQYQNAKTAMEDQNQRERSSGSKLRAHFR